MNELWFEFNGVSSAELGVEVRALPGDISWGQRNETFEVPGRDGLLHILNGELEEAEASIDLYLPYEQDDFREDGGAVPLGMVKKWLHGGGTIRFSTDPDHFYKVMFLSEKQWTFWVQGFMDRLATVPMIVKPYAYRVQPFRRTLTEGTVIVNPGSASAQPVIKLRGTGDIELLVGETNLKLIGLDGEIVVDGVSREVFDEEAYRNDIHEGDYPELIPGKNEIGWEGNVEWLEIAVYWRDL